MINEYIHIEILQSKLNAKNHNKDVLVFNQGFMVIFGY